MYLIPSISFIFILITVLIEFKHKAIFQFRANLAKEFAYILFPLWAYSYLFKKLLYTYWLSKFKLVNVRPELNY